jgi:hypothetical protein
VPGFVTSRVLAAVQTFLNLRYSNASQPASRRKDGGSFALGGHGLIQHVIFGALALDCDCPNYWTAVGCRKEMRESLCA